MINDPRDFQGTAIDWKIDYRSPDFGRPGVYLIGYFESWGKWARAELISIDFIARVAHTRVGVFHLDKPNRDWPNLQPAL